MKVLVTGAGGMVGSHLVEILYNKNIDVLGTYYTPTVNIAEINKRIPLQECDIRNSQLTTSIITKFMPDQIYHLAAQSFPTVSWEKPYETIDTNINGTIAVFEAIKKIRKTKNDYNPIVIVACSSAEYGDSFYSLKKDELIKEDAILLPLHPYGVSKVGQDLISYQYYKNDNIRCIRARIFNSTGTRKINDVTSDFTKRAIIAEKTGNFKISVGNLKTKRAIMDQRDLIKALMLLAKKGAPGEAYNISSEYIYEMQEIINIIERILGHKFQLEVDEKLLRPSDEPLIAGDISKLKADTGWSQDITFEQTITDMLNYWRSVL